MNHKHAKTLAQFFQHPISNNIQWNEVMKLLKGLGAEIEINKNSGKTVVKLNTCEIILPKQTHKFIYSHKEVIELRHFFERAGFKPSSLKE
jgi:hypothetical protein